MNRIPTWLIVLIVIAVLIGSKMIFFPKETMGGNKSAGGKPTAPVAVNYYIVKAVDFDNDVFTAGKIGAFNEVNMVPEVAGKIVSINFKEGETVSKGSLLVKLNDADLQAQLIKVKTQIKLSEQKLKRLEQLLKINGISQEEYDMQENELQSLKADEAYTQAQIAKTSLYAPFTGQAGLKNISEGSFVNSSTPIVSLVQMQPVYVEFSVPEKYNDIFEKGDVVKFKSEKMDSSASFEARVYAIEPRVDEATRSIRARALYTGSHTFYPGSFVNTFVDLGKTSGAIMVPTQAVIATLKGQKVFVSRNNIATEVQIKVGLRTDKAIQVTEGLSVGDTVLTTGLLALKKESVLKLIPTKR